VSVTCNVTALLYAATLHVCTHLYLYFYTRIFVTSNVRTGFRDEGFDIVFVSFFPILTMISNFFLQTQNQGNNTTGSIAPSVQHCFENRMGPALQTVQKRSCPHCATKWACVVPAPSPSVVGQLHISWPYQFYNCTYCFCEVLCVGVKLGRSH